jgi:ABC-type multidrug transport system fused ATPase/permease subunit
MKYVHKQIREEIAGDDLAKKPAQPREHERHIDAENVADMFEEGAEPPEQMSLKDHWDSFRLAVQEMVDSELANEKLENDPQIKMISEVITPELMAQYKQIVAVLNQKTKRNKEHPKREFIDINEDKIADQIATWANNLVAEVRQNGKTGLDESDFEDLKSQCWLLFNSMASVMNTRSVEKDISIYLRDNPLEFGNDEEKEKQRKALINELEEQYPFDKTDIEVLVDLVKAKTEPDPKYSLEILAKTMAKAWEDLELGNSKMKIGLISTGYLISQGLNSAAPSLFQDLFKGGNLNLALFLEYGFVSRLSKLLQARIDTEMAEFLREINQKLNERITNSLFFHEFEFVHKKNMGEIFATIDRGKKATEDLVEQTITKLIPTLSGISMSLVFLSKINPILGGISAISLPVMYQIAKKQNDKIWPIYEKERREGEKITSSISSIKSGYEEVRTSPESPKVAGHIREKMDNKDALAAKRYADEIKMLTLSELPHHASEIISAAAGCILQQMGEISGGAVLANIIYSNQLNRPAQELANLYFSKFSRYVQDIQRMEEIMGSDESLDLPEGEKEKQRTGVSGLKNYDIDIKGVNFKDILRNIDIKIKQGEFVSIVGLSGAGKSTLIRNIVGLYKPDSGSIQIGGVETDDIKRYGQESIYSAMSYCNQSPQIFEAMTLRENLKLWTDADIDDEQIKQILKDLDLDKFVDKLDEEVKNLSGGEKVRIGVARTLIKGAKIMLLDEPTASVDSSAGTEIRKILKQVHDKYPDTTIVCVTHDPELMANSDRLIDITKVQSEAA